MRSLSRRRAKAGGSRTSARVVALAAVLTTAWGAPAGAAVPSGNLLRNPGAEDGPGARDTSTVPVPQWTTTGSFTARAYGTPGTLGPFEGGGANFFAGGEGSEVATGSQTVDVAADSELVDACRVNATASGWFGGLAGQGDSAGAEVAFIGAGGENLGGLPRLGDPTAADRGGTSGYLAYSQTRQVAPGTRAIRFTVSARRTDGTYNDGYADNLSLSLAETEPPSGGVALIPEAGRSVIVRRVRGTVVLSYTITIRVPQGSCIGNDDIQTIVDAIAVRLVGKPVIDATRGEVALTAAQDASGVAQTALFSKGAFKLAQKAAAQPVTELTMTGGDFNKCSRAKSSRGPASRRVVRRLWGTGRGRFRTRGRYSSATVRGTAWRTEDRCDGTLTTVPRSERGSEVVVRDLARRRTVTLRAGESYLAKPRR